MLGRIGDKVIALTLAWGWIKSLFSKIGIYFVIAGIIALAIYYILRRSEQYGAIKERLESAIDQLKQIEINRKDRINVEDRVRTITDPERQRLRDKWTAPDPN